MYIAAYGTLRKGGYNFDRFNLKYIETKKINGYKMYDLGSYPCIVPAEDEEITIDILECNENTLHSIRRMEIGAGYQHQTINIDDKECEIYYFNRINANYKQITQGDYIKYTEEQFNK